MEVNGFAEALLGLEVQLDEIVAVLEASTAADDPGASDNLVYAALGLLSLHKTVKRWSSTARMDGAVTPGVRTARMPPEDLLR